MPEELEGFDESFICGTAAEVTPVAEIGPYTFTPGEMTRALMDAYAAEVSPEPARGCRVRSFANLIN